jgi:hypothetical protein
VTGDHSWPPSRSSRRRKWAVLTKRFARSRHAALCGASASKDKLLDIGFHAVLYQAFPAGFHLLVLRDIIPDLRMFAESATLIEGESRNVIRERPFTSNKRRAGGAASQKPLCWHGLPRDLAPLPTAEDNQECARALKAIVFAECGAFSLMPLSSLSILDCKPTASSISHWAACNSSCLISLEILQHPDSQPPVVPNCRVAEDPTSACFPSPAHRFTRSTSSLALTSLSIVYTSHSTVSKQSLS